MKEQSEIKVSDSWNQFFASGKVEDYLNYIAGCKATEHDDVEARWAGEGSHAGFNRGNRNHIEADSYR